MPGERTNVKRPTDAWPPNLRLAKKGCKKAAAIFRGGLSESAGVCRWTASSCILKAGKGVRSASLGCRCAHLRSPSPWSCAGRCKAGKCRCEDKDVLVIGEPGHLLSRQRCSGDAVTDCNCRGCVGLGCDVCVLALSKGDSCSLTCLLIPAKGSFRHVVSWPLSMYRCSCAPSVSLWSMAFVCCWQSVVNMVFV